MNEELILLFKLICYYFTEYNSKWRLLYPEIWGNLKENLKIFELFLFLRFKD